MMIMNLIEDQADSLLASSLSLDVVPRLCRLRTVHCWPLDQDFVVPTTYSGKPNILAIPSCEKTTAHWEWEMARVACTHPMETSGMT